MAAWGNAWGTSNNAWVDAWGNTSAVAAVATEPTGGWEHHAHESSYNAARQRLKRRKEELRRHRQAIRWINRWR